MPRHAGFERPAVGMQSLELRQQRRMNVEHATAPTRDEPRRQKPHEAGKAHDVDAMRYEFGIERAFEGFAVFAERPMIDDSGRNACVARVREP